MRWSKVNQDDLDVAKCQRHAIALQMKDNVSQTYPVDLIECKNNGVYHWIIKLKCNGGQSYRFDDLHLVSEAGFGLSQSSRSYSEVDSADVTNVDVTNADANNNSVDHPSENIIPISEEASKSIMNPSIQIKF
ncbi:hypothetical protein HAX54_019599 [Datura stramonium]|uniref:Uncharacterized protein n=1 Tax=Datura stramonium TaxID=4076 RepID=A0ABS8UR32_DATST|nr:hypothetical protein [Datura stramonium]